MKFHACLHWARCVPLLAGAALAVSCGHRAAADAAGGAPATPVVDQESDGTVIRADHPERFPLVTAGRHKAAPALTVSGVVAPDVSRAVPVVSLASGRVVEVRARLGDRVRRGQLLLRIQSGDVSNAISEQRKAVVDETLARTQCERARDLYARGAIAKKDLEVTEDAEAKAVVDLDNSTERLRMLGLDPARAVVTGGIVSILAPAGGVITEQNVTTASGVKTLDNSPNLFTISDLSRVWILCDVHENDIGRVRVGDSAEIHVAAYPDQVLTGRVSNIGPILEPGIRTGKVRIEISNPGLLRVGMFVTATLLGATAEEHAVVPATAVLHLHDHDWVFVSDGSGVFQRQQVVSGALLPDNMQEIVSGLRPGQHVVARALVLQNTADQ